MKTTLPEDEDASASEWVLFVAVHPEERYLGTKRVFLRGARVELGRDEDFFGAGALSDGRISRRHARLDVDASGVLHVTDLGSSNGTHVNGARVERVSLAPGDVIRVGGVLFVAQRSPVTLYVPRCALAGVGPALARMQHAIDALSASDDVALVEEPGSGASRIAATLHDLRGGERREFSLGAWVDRLPIPFEEAVSTQRGGTILLRSLPPKGSLARKLVRERLAEPKLHPDTRRIFILDASASDDVELVKAFGVTMIRVPPLRERPEDIALSLRARCATLGCALPSLSLRGWLTLLRASWPANLAQLEATVDRACVALANAEPEDVDRWIQDAARSELAPSRAPTPSATVATSDERAFVFAITGRWFALPTGERVSLHRREVLARVLAALVRARQQHPGRVVRTSELIELAWPGEKLVEGSGENRLHVALSNLRQLGLRQVLTRVEDGYRIDPEAPARWIDE